MSSLLVNRAPLTSGALVQGCLVVNLVRVPEASEWPQIRNEILESIARQRPTGVILVLDQADVLDEKDLTALLRTQTTVRLMGLKLVLSGLRPEVVAAWSLLTELPSQLMGYATVQDAIDAFALHQT